jgi:hypothetical protein
VSTLTASPSIVSIFNVAAGPVTVTASTTAAGPITASLADGSFVGLSPASVPAPSGVFTLSPGDTDGGDDTLTLSDGTSTLLIPVALGGSEAGNIPTAGANTLTTVLAYIRVLADAPQQPSAANLGLLLNQAVIQVGDELEPILQTVQLNVIDGTSTITLPLDVGDIEKVIYSPGDLNNPGSIPYEVYELGPGVFAEFQMGTQGNYGLAPAGPVMYYQRLSDMSGRIRLQFAPYPPPGFFQLYYHPKLNQFDLNSPNSTIQLDPTYLRMLSLLTAHDVCLQQRDVARAQYLGGLFDKEMAKKKITVGRRNNARTSQTRDVTSEGYSALPTWYPV